MKYFYPAVVHYDGKHNVYFASIPDIIGCQCSGAVLGETLDQLRYSLCEELWNAEETGDTISCPSSEESLRNAYRKDMVCVIMADTSAFRQFRTERLARGQQEAKAWSEAAKKHDRHAGVLQRVFGLR